MFKRHSKALVIKLSEIKRMNNKKKQIDTLINN